jgi:starch phosphorylase
MNKTLFLNELKGLETAGKDVITLYNEISALAMKCAGSPDKTAGRRCAYYMSMEFLVGRGFYNNLMELGVLEETRAVLSEKGVDINIFEEIEDAALGNGGLGRLAACFLDSAAGLGLPLYGYGIRYKYGLFKQAIDNGFQVELPDDWQKFGDPWSVRKDDEARDVVFADMTVKAVPYDMPVFGKRINTLRLWQAEGEGEAFRISEYLYPADDTEEGKLLRLRQEYFFSAATVAELVENFVKQHGKKFENFSKYNVIQLNDTHPVIAVAELIRLLTSKYRLTFAEALKVAKNTFAYTNHTVLPEALETWKEEYVKKILPEIADIILNISVFATREQLASGCTKEEAAEMAIAKNGNFYMANLAVYVAGKVNGVAKLHTEILKNDLFAIANKTYPDKFRNKTNGITHRRWLELCNSELASLLDETIGKGWRENIAELDKLNGFGEETVKKFIEVKRKKKKQLLSYIEEKEGIEIPSDFLVFAQVKRLHEYKRQLMTAFAVLEIYYRLKNGEIGSFHPTVFIFGAKSAPAYKRAKAIIKFINEIAAKINSDSSTNGLLKVVFVQNYNVSYAEKIVAGTDVSLQVSTAGLEASGTGNMKFMMNGAVTCGTMDGANIEIVELAGKENNYIFGAEVDEIEKLKKNGYKPEDYIASDVRKNVVNSLTNGTFSDGGTCGFEELYSSLIKGASWHKPDNYFVLYDLDGFIDAILKINRDYTDKIKFSAKQLTNTANSAYFSSDRTIKEYASDIWEI